MKRNAQFSKKLPVVLVCCLMLVIASPAVVFADGNLIILQTYMDAGRYDDAETRLLSLVKDNPSNVQYWKMLALCFLYQGKIPETASADQKIVELDRRDVESRIRLATFYETHNKEAQARILYKELERLIPNTAGVYKKLCQLAQRADDEEEALFYLKRYLSLYRDDVKAHDQLMNLVSTQTLESDQLVDHTDRELADKQARAKPSKPDRAGKVVSREEAKSSAAIASKSAIKAPFTSDQAYRVALAKEKVSVEIAMKMYSQNISRFPSDSRNFYRLGVLYSRDPTKLHKAVAMLERAGTLKNTPHDAWIELSKVYVQMGKPHYAVEACRSCLTQYPRSLEGHRRAGIILLQQGKTNQSITHLRAALALASQDLNILYSLSRAYSMSKKFDLALKYAKAAKKIKPDNPDIIVELAKLYRLTNQKTRAIHEVMRLLAPRKNNRYMFLYADLLMADGQYLTAENVLREIRLPAEHPRKIDVLMMLAKALRAQGKYENALEVYRKVVRIKPNFLPALYETAEVYRLVDPRHPDLQRVVKL